MTAQSEAAQDEAQQYAEQAEEIHAQTFWFPDTDEYRRIRDFSDAFPTKYAFIESTTGSTA